MAALATMADMLYEAVNTGDVDVVMDLLKKGANVNVLPSCGRTALGRAAQLGHLAIVCLLLDAEKFYTTPEEEDVDTESLFSCISSSSSSHVGAVSGVTSCAPRGTLPQDQRLSPTTAAVASASSVGNLRPTLGTTLLTPQGHKCCSPSIDSETCTCSDELWGLDLSDSNQQSDWEPGCCNKELPSNNNEETSEVDIQEPYSASVCSLTTSQYTTSNIGYYVFEYREEEEDTGESSGPVVSSTEDSDSAMISERRHQYHPHRQSSSVLLQRTLGRGRANIVSSDSEFETENRRRRRHARHNHRPHRHDRDNGVRVDTPDAEHMTALHLAVQRGLVEVITLLLEGGARVNNKMNDKSTPLHIAASRGYTDILELLLGHGAKIDSLDSSDRTALIVAVSRSNVKVVQLLLERGAKVNIEEIHGKYCYFCLS
ncbi:Ankyrin repeat domain-containing protein 50 [Chionoecetes opilio]|uniref:Ankyrin repeat domain-containing protein 50 n=1 Tax=Chionoecetes opilio TaxID=41210 RepID=A0A8J4YJ17_CHIOP|nr:Ankyrin repeat domain-containing protein 50 [Chionoecetes opilio]